MTSLLLGMDCLIPTSAFSDVFLLFSFRIRLIIFRSVGGNPNNNPLCGRVISITCMYLAPPVLFDLLFNTLEF